MIVVDSLAVVAMMFGEPEAAALVARLAEDPKRVMSVAGSMETGTVLAGRRQRNRFKRSMIWMHVWTRPELASRRSMLRRPGSRLRARIRYGRGMGHGGVLHFGDSFAYALAMTQMAPLLLIGDDFGTTDVAVAL